MIELRNLEAFVTVAEELSFRRAAERLNVSQSPLSQQIKRLEREVGTQLLRRTTRQVALTAAGAAFLDEARRAIDAAHAAPRLAKQAAAGQIGHARLGFTGPGSYEILLLMARVFRRRRPGVRLDIVGPALSGELVELLHHGDVDAGLLRLPVPTAGLTMREITRHRIVAALPADHRYAAQGSVGVDGLLDEPIVSYPLERAAASSRLVADAYERRGRRPNIVQEAPDTHTLMLLVGAGVGIAFVPESAGHLKVPGVVLVPVGELPPFTLVLAWRTEDDNPALGALRAALEEALSGEEHV